MAGFINFINSNFRYIIPVDSISMIINTSTSSVSVYFKNGKFSSGSYQETNMHATKTLTNESITNFKFFLRIFSVFFEPKKFV